MENKQSTFIADLLGRHLPFRERIFRMILLIAGFTDLFALIETLVLVGFEWSVLPLAILLVSVVLSLILTVKYNMHKLAEYIIDFVMILMVFPDMFFVNGGVHGGAPIWFIISMIYTFLMFSGKGLIFFILLDVVVDIVVYAYAYLHPEMIKPLNSLFSEYTDSLFGVIVVGLALGAMIKFQMSVYEQERAVVEKQKQELEDMSQSKDRFFTNMSKEIITPLNTVMGYNEMILRENPQGDTNTYANGVKDAGKMLLALVNDIVDVSQLETKKLEIKEADYSSFLLIQDIHNMMDIILKDKPVEFYCDVEETIPAVLRGDQKRIVQILTNLLMNSIQHTKDGYIALHVGVSKWYQNMVELEFQVEDTGSGIRKEDLDSLFDIYKRVDRNKEGSTQGAGLGLTITKYLVDLMQGEILVDSIYTKGSVFTVKISQQVVDASQIHDIERIYKQRQLLPKEYKQRFEAPEARILLVDDNQMDIEIIRQLLAATHIRIDTAASCDECLRMTMKHFYHVILMDHLLPGRDLSEVVREVQRQENGLCRDSATIAMVGNISPEMERMYYKSGFDSCLEKPIDGASLEENILAFLPDDTVEYQSYQVLKEEGMPRRRPIEKRKKQVVISTDCVAEIPKEMLDKYEINVMYLYIRTPNGRFADTKEIDTDSLGIYLTDDSSSAYADSVSIEEYEAFYIKQLDIAEQVVHISMAANAGKSYSVATDAAKSFGHVYVVDSGHISCGQTILVLYAARLAQQGYSAEEICKQIQLVSKNVETQFIMPSANVFYRNGYTTALVANACRMFRLRPVLAMRKSTLEIESVCVGAMDYARKWFIQKTLRRKKNINTDIVFITHVGLSVKQQQMIIDEIARYVKFDRVIVQKASFSCACNAGMGTFGFAFYRNSKDEKNIIK